MEKDLSKIIARTLTQTETSEERRELERWEKESKKNGLFLEKIQLFWKIKPEKQPIDASPAWDRLKEQITTISLSHTPSSKFKIFSQKWVAAVACLILILSVGSSVFWISKYNQLTETSNWCKIETELGQRSQVVLPDGSKVSLNAGSTLEYPSLFGKRSREVRFKGEGYFEVFHDSFHPFNVETPYYKIKVLGTKFNVRAYEDEDCVSAILVSGSVEVNLKENGKEKKFRLKPGQKLVIEKATSEMKVLNMQAEKYVKWTTGTMVFNNLPFKELIIRLEKWYGVEILFEPSQFSDIHYSGTLENLSIDQVLEFIDVTIPIEYSREKNKIVIKPEK